MRRIELDAASLERLTASEGAGARARVEARCASADRVLVGYTSYRRGSAFLVPGRP